MKKVAYIRASNIYDDSRASKEINALLENGYFVSVFGWDRSGISEKKCAETIKNINVRFTFYPVRIQPGQGNSFKNIIGWIRWLNKVLKQEKYDIIHACDLDSGISGYKYSKKTKCKFVYDIYDYYIECHHVPKFTEFFLEREEIKIINNSDLTIICTEERKKQIRKASPKKTIVIYNSPQVDTLSLESDEMLYDYVYCGTLCKNRLLKEVFDKYHSNIHLKMAIAGTGEFALNATELSEKYENFSYLGTIPYAEVIEKESQSKVISAIYDPSLRNHQLCAPNKFYEALALGKPIIVCNGTGIDEVVRKNNIGTVIDYNANEFYAALYHLLEHPSICAEMGKRARLIYEQKYQWNVMKGILIDEYTKLG